MTGELWISGYEKYSRTSYSLFFCPRNDRGRGYFESPKMIGDEVKMVRIEEKIEKIEEKQKL
jgi:hypothetical protein